MARSAGTSWRRPCAPRRRGHCATPCKVLAPSPPCPAPARLRSPRSRPHTPANRRPLSTCTAAAQEPATARPATYWPDDKPNRPTGRHDAARPTHLHRAPERGSRLGVRPLHCDHCHRRLIISTTAPPAVSLFRQRARTALQGRRRRGAGIDR